MSRLKKAVSRTKTQRSHDNLSKRSRACSSDILPTLSPGAFIAVRGGKLRMGHWTRADARRENHVYKFTCSKKSSASASPAI